MYATTSSHAQAHVVTIRTNRFGGYAPVVHPRGTTAPKTPTSGIAFPTPDQAIAYAREKFGVHLVALTDTFPGSTPVSVA